MGKVPDKKLKVGILLDSADGYMNKRILNDCIDLAEEYNVLPVFFLGGVLEPAREPAGSDFLYSLPHPGSLDALIVFPNSIAPWDPITETRKILDRIPDLPVYAANEAMPGLFSVAINEKPAIHALVDHLVLTHGYKEFSLITGPDAPASISRRRRQLFEEQLARHGISVPENKIFLGRFEEDDGKRAVEALFRREDSIPEVIISLNDQMAAGTIEELLNRGIAVPADIAVTGFDDVAETSLLPCTLTTIHVPVWEMMTALFEKIAGDLRGRKTAGDQRKPDAVYLNATYIRRESCGTLRNDETHAVEMEELVGEQIESIYSPHQSRNGTFRRDLENVLEETLTTGETDRFSEFSQKIVKKILRTGDISSSFIDIFSSQWTISLLKHDENETRILINALFLDAIRLLVRGKMQTCARIHANDRGALEFSRNSTSILSRKPTMQEALQEIGKNLSMLGIERCILVLTDPENPEQGSTRLSYKKRYFREIPTENFTKFPVSRLVNNGLDSITVPIAVLPIAINTDFFGYMVLSITENSFEDLSLVQELVSRLIAGAASNESLSSQIQFLERKNTALSRLSTIDEFTGLHNRRVLHETGKDLFRRTLNEGKTCCCIFLDMDGLKKINDEWGHPEGDTAIKTLAAILRKSFRSRDMIVRYGGDEFIVLMFDIKKATVSSALARITRQLDLYNKSSGKPWMLQASWGVTVVPPDRITLSFEDLIEETDDRLYEEKQRRREAGLR